MSFFHLLLNTAITASKQVLLNVSTYIMKGSSSTSFKNRNMLGDLTQLADASQLAR